MTDEIDTNIIAFPVEYRGPFSDIGELLDIKRMENAQNGYEYMTEVILHELVSIGVDLPHTYNSVEIMKSKLLLAEALESYICHTQGISHSFQDLASKIFEGDTLQEIKLVDTIKIRTTSTRRKPKKAKAVAEVKENLPS